MPMYIGLINWTDQGVKNAKESVARGDAFKKMAADLGCEVQGIFWTMGRYDIATRIVAPDDATISALMLKVAQLGNIRSETMRAYTEEEFAGIMKQVNS
jgi:uncharacterized protein with GYD domain